MKKLIFLLFLLIILGGLYSYKTWFSVDTGTYQVLKIGDNAIYVANQKPGNVIIAQVVSIAKDSYVVIYENKNDKLGMILGNSMPLKAGDHNNVLVGLVREVIHGESLFAVLHEDSGDGIFSPSLDIPLRDDERNMIFMKFFVDQFVSKPGGISL